MAEKQTLDNRILDLLGRNRQGLTLQHVFKELRISRKERGKVEDRLRVLEGTNLVRRVRNRYLLPLRAGLIRGLFETSGRGFGFVIREDGRGEDIFIPARFSKSALRGDIVEVLAEEDRRKGKPEGKVVRIVRKAKKHILGVYDERFGNPVLRPFDAASSNEIPLHSRGAFFPSPGAIVAADRSDLVLVEVLGRPEDPGVDTRVIIRKYGLAEVFSAEALAEAEAAASLSGDAAHESRADYRDWTTFTIDGETAQDFDDAVSIRRREDGGWRLGVHIADVSHYVRPGTALDLDASRRGTSVYFPDLTLPMLPEQLSNDLCSLRPRLDRRTVSALIDFGADGTVLEAAFHPSVIRTAERLTYTSVFKVFEGDSAERRALARVVPDLLEMRELARLLRRRRIAAGSLDFDLLEAELVYKEGKLHSVATFSPNEAHKLIEEFMVAANVAVASALSRLKVPSIYRVHPPPAESDLERLRETLAAFHIHLPKAERLASPDLQAAIRAAEGTAAEKFVNVQVLRALRLAHYSPDNVGHYGLAQDEYTHFTSPIRRYPDLVVHRILKEVLAGGRPRTPDLEGLARHSSEEERRAEEAERDLIEWRIFRLLKERLGEEVTGIVTDITRAGLLVELDEYFVQGVLAYQDLGGDFFRTRSRGVLAGSRTGRKFELGQSLRVQIAAVDPVARRAQLVLKKYGDTSLISKTIRSPREDFRGNK
jgi:ribonuclease R